MLGPGIQSKHEIVSPANLRSFLFTHSSPSPPAVSSQNENANSAETFPTNRKYKKKPLWVESKHFSRGKYFLTESKDIKIYKPSETVLLC